MITDFRWWQKYYVCDRFILLVSFWIGYQHLKKVINISKLCHQHILLPTYVTNINLAEIRRIKLTKHISKRKWFAYFLNRDWIQPFLAKSENEIDSFNEFEAIYDSMTQENRTEIARKIIELSCRHSALVDFCLSHGQGKLGEKTTFKYTSSWSYF